MGKKAKITVLFLYYEENYMSFRELLLKFEKITKFSNFYSH